MRRSVLRMFQLMLAFALSAALLTGCGFQLRSSRSMAFQTVAVTPEQGGGVALELIRNLGDAVRPLGTAAGGERPQVVVDILQETREKSVVGVNASGQVREFQLRMRVSFRARTAAGHELIAATDITQQRDISFNETVVLSKEAEEALLYRDMQTDIVQQILRRLSAIKTLDAP